MFRCFLSVFERQLDLKFGELCLTTLHKYSSEAVIVAGFIEFVKSCNH